MAAQDITQERLILGNLVQLLLFRLPLFALFLLPNRATSLFLSCLAACLSLCSFSSLFSLENTFLLLQSSFTGVQIALFSSHPSPARSLHLLVTTWAATHQLFFGTDPLPSRPSDCHQHSPFIVSLNTLKIILGAPEVTKIEAVNANSWLQVSTVQGFLRGLHKEAFNLALIGRLLYVK